MAAIVTTGAFATPAVPNDGRRHAAASVMVISDAVEHFATSPTATQTKPTSVKDFGLQETC
jgi:hypothetical protein